MRLPVHTFPCLFVGSCSLLLVACSGVSRPPVAPMPAAPGLHSLRVASANPASGVAITVTPADDTKAVGGVTPFTRVYTGNAAVTLTAPATSAAGTFSGWTGCPPAGVNGTICIITPSGQNDLTANYTPVHIAIAPGKASATIGETLQLTALVGGAPSGSQGVTWSVAAPRGWSGSAGSITNATDKKPANGLYTTPYPAPANVTVTATSIAYPAASASVEMVLSAPAPATGPALAVDAGHPTHSIDPLIYGMNFFSLDAKAEKASGMTVDRFGGDATSRYNYVLDTTNSASDWFFENSIGTSGKQDTGEFNTQFVADKAAGVKTINTVNVLGWVARDGKACSFPLSVYPKQNAQDPYAQDRHCGDGQTPDKKNITGNDPTDTSIAVGPAFAGEWTKYLVRKFGNAASGGVAFYSLDNEPAWWDGGHRDVHPLPSTYDEVTQNGIATAEAVKSADPTAAVTGPVIDNWWNYFYSKKDMESGWNTGFPCFQPWSNPVDRKAHGGVPFIEYYLQQMKLAEGTFGARVLDYLDLHTYYAGSYDGSSVGLAPVGDTGAQKVRLDSTRALWDSTYHDPETPQPNYATDPDSTLNCKLPPHAPRLIPMMHDWIAKNYPGTRTAITEYNWGGQENINGAIAQADVLGIFGREGLDMGTLWGPPDPVKQLPGLMAFEAFRNYDGAGSRFGDAALPSTSADQGELAVYGARRSSDDAVTVIVLNKTYGDLTSSLALAHLTPAGPARSFLYSNANLSAIVAQPDVALRNQGSGSITHEITFPAQSITIVVLPAR